MKIYIVTENDYDGGIIHGVYSNEEAAQLHREAGGEYPNIKPEFRPWYRYEVEEFEVLDKYESV